jgi:hypothetical protein
MERGSYDDIVIGTPVFAPDGDRLGRVKEVQGRFFKVDAPMAPDFWLDTDCIRTASAAGGVTLAVDPDKLPDYRAANTDLLI